MEEVQKSIDDVNWLIFTAIPQLTKKLRPYLAFMDGFWLKKRRKVLEMHDDLLSAETEKRLAELRNR